MKRAMKIVALGSVVNIILDSIFIKVLDMGMSGAVIATIIGIHIPLLPSLLTLMAMRSKTLIIRVMDFMVMIYKSGNLRK